MVISFPPSSTRSPSSSARAAANRSAGRCLDEVRRDAEALAADVVDGRSRADATDAPGDDWGEEDFGALALRAAHENFSRPVKRLLLASIDARHNLNVVAVENVESALYSSTNAASRHLSSLDVFVAASPLTAGVYF